MSGREQNWWGDKKMIYSDVKNTAGAKNKGCGNYVKVSELDEAVWEKISAILDDPAKIMEYKESKKENNLLESELSHIDAEKEKNKKGQQRLYKLVAMSEDINLSDVRDQIKELQTAEKALQLKYNQIEKELKALGRDNSEEIMKRTIAMKFKHNEWTFEAKQEAIRSLVKQVIITKDKEVELHLF
jgi:site-specific DNA recombinase